MGDKRAPAPGEEDVIWVVPEERRIALDIPKNMIVHLFVDRACSSLLGARDVRQPLSPTPMLRTSVHDTTSRRPRLRPHLARLFATS
ncbi:MAG: hypothetical protein R3B70_15255 [Polyangiaceae bacterium]